MFDVLGNLLEPYSAQLGQFAGAITVLQFLSGLALLNDIRKRGCSDPYPAEPFLGGFVLTVLSLKLGAVMGDQAMIKVNIIGFGINTVFMVVFYWYASNAYKTKIWAKIGITGAIIAVCLAYTQFENPKHLEFRLGLLLTAILVALVGSPLLSLNKIIEKQSTEGMPFPLILSGTIVAASWMLYGFSIRNEVMVYQNMLLFVLSAIQLSLFAIYPNTNGPSGTTASVGDGAAALKSKSSNVQKSRVNVTDKKKD